MRCTSFCTMYHATYLECKMLPAYPLSNIWPAGERPVVLPVYTQDTSPDMMMDNEGSPYMPGAPGTDDLVKVIVGKAIVEKVIVERRLRGRNVMQWRPRKATNRKGWSQTR